MADNIHNKPHQVVLEGPVSDISSRTELNLKGISLYYWDEKKKGTLITIKIRSNMLFNLHITLEIILNSINIQHRLTLCLTTWFHQVFKRNIFRKFKLPQLLFSSFAVCSALKLKTLERTRNDWRCRGHLHDQKSRCFVWDSSSCSCWVICRLMAISRGMFVHSYHLLPVLHQWQPQWSGW